MTEKTEKRILEIKARVFDMLNERKQYQDTLQKSMQRKYKEYIDKQQIEMENLQTELTELESK